MAALSEQMVEMQIVYMASRDVEYKYKMEKNIQVYAENSCFLIDPIVLFHLV